jgi:DNA-binding response OmpR family regulator
MDSILIVNNNVDLLTQLIVIFENAGYQVIATADSLTALDLFERYRPNAVIIDIYMNGKDGFEVTKAIRKVCKKTFILAVSARKDYLSSIICLGANFSLLTSTSLELIVNTIAVAKKEQLLFKPNTGSLFKKPPLKILKIA